MAIQGEKKEAAAGIRAFTTRAKGEVETRREKKSHALDMPEYFQQKAELISAHFLLPEGSTIADMGCGTGEVTYVLAQLNPQLKVIGVDHDPKVIDFARAHYRLPNLTFRVSDLTVPDMEDESIDGIVNSNMLHGIYSAAGYNPDVVGALLDKQVRKLKAGGTILIRDYMMPPEREMVLLEVLNGRKGTGSGPQALSDGELLMLFSRTARPLPTGGSEGFFIEEIAPRRAGTRLFRLPHKWALEFVHRKDHRAEWDERLHEEFTFYTWQDYCREFTRAGMRMMFSSPYWNPWVIKNHFKGSIQMYSDDGKPLAYPATSYFMVAQKLADRQSVLIEERRPSHKPLGDLQVVTVRDKKSGVIQELVKRPGEICDVVPYRITPEGKLIVYARAGYPRPIVNAGSRGRHNLDGKKWSGHLIEPISMDVINMSDDAETNRRMIFGYVNKHASLRPKAEDKWFVGDAYYPAPDQIDEAIEAVYVEVENPARHSWPVVSEEGASFTELGTITELDAHQVLLASQVGLLPDPRLELHVIELMSRYKIAPPRWIGEEMPRMVRQSVRPRKPEDVLKEAQRTGFTEERKGVNTHMKPVKAVFIEEGKVGHQTRGLSAQDVEYIVTDDSIENIAIVLPITRDWDNNLLVALDPKIMAVPNRLGGDGAMLNAPTFPLPKDVRTIDDAKAFVASKFKVPAERVAQLGASFFTHASVTPQRIYLFTVSSPAQAESKWGMRYMLVDALVRWVWEQRHYRINTSILKAIARTHIRMGGTFHDMNMVPRDDLAKNQGFSLSTDKVSLDAATSHSSAPSRILGQRGARDKTAPSASARVISALHRHVRELKSGNGAASLSKRYDRSRVPLRGNLTVASLQHNVQTIKEALARPPQKPQGPELSPLLSPEIK